jgi:dimethylaniline monooxygenase (N-oxide forming)
MEREIDAHQAQLGRRFVRSTRHTLEVDYLPYMDSLAQLLDCVPRPQDFLLSDPRLAQALLFGPNVSYVYRLRGKHRWGGARQAILGVGQRTEKCLSGRRPEAQGEDHTRLLLLVVAIVALALLWMASGRLL